VKLRRWDLFLIRALAAHSLWRHGMGTKFCIHHPKRNKLIRSGLVIAWGDFDSAVVSSPNLIHGVLLSIDKAPKAKEVVRGRVYSVRDVWAVVFPQVDAGDYVLEIWKLRSAAVGTRDRILGRRRLAVQGPSKENITLDAPASDSTIYANFLAGGAYNGDGTAVTCSFTYGGNADAGTPVVNPPTGGEGYWLQSHSIAGVTRNIPDCTYSATYKGTALENINITLAAETPQPANPGDD
jgi:hypothetical protein